MAKKRKKSKYGVRSIGKSFSNAAAKLREAQRKKKEYLASPEYQKKVAAARKRKLDELNYQIQLQKRKQQLQRTRAPKSSGSATMKKKINKPLGLDLGSELGLS